MAKGFTVSRPNFHLDRDINGPIDGFLQPDLELELLETAAVNDYWHVRLADGRVGFIHVDHVRLAEDRPVPDASNDGGVKIGVVAGGRPLVHIAPDVNSPADGFLETGTPLHLLDQPNEYWRVRLLDGRIAFVHSDFVQRVSEAPPAGGASGPGLSSATDVEEWFRSKTGKSFIPWFNEVRAGDRVIANTAGTAQAFEALCNNLPFVFGQPASIEQFLCLVSVAVGETGGSLSPRPELVGRADLGAPGIAYAFNQIPQIPKTSYNVPPNRTAFDLFHDPVFMDRFAHLPLAAELRNTADHRWAGTSYPLDAAPTSTDPGESGVILECDFYKFRGRGFIQTTWRSNYVRLIEFVQTANTPDPVLQRYQEAWVGRDPEEIATTSTNTEWNELFEQTGFRVACAAILIHSQDHGGYLNVSSEHAALAADNDIPGSVFRFGFRINGGFGYARDLRARVLRMCELLA